MRGGGCSGMWGTSAHGSNLTSPHCNAYCVPPPRLFQLLPLLIIISPFQTGKLRHRVGTNWPMITQVASWRAGIWTQTGFGSRNHACSHAVVGSSFCCASQTRLFNSWTPWSPPVPYKSFVFLLKLARVDFCYLQWKETYQRRKCCSPFSLLFPLQTLFEWRLHRFPINDAAMQCRGNVD